jgi:uncharacterized protein (DUF1015 family)
VPRFSPFRGLRYDLDRVDPAAVTAPPYDVIDADARAGLVGRDPHNVVRIDLPVPDDTDGDPYERAAERFAAWQRDGVLRRDAEPGFYVYRMDHRDEAGRPRRTTGVLGALTLARPGEAEPGEQPILPHEHTTPKARSDRLLLQRATRANLSPIWGLSPTAGLTDLLPVDDPPIASWDDGEGVRHTLWRTTDEGATAAVAAAVAAEPLLIADGHHRYETALTYRDEHPTADTVLTYVVELDDDELTVRPIHRLLSGLPADLDLVRALEPFFEIDPATELRTDDGLVLVTAAGSWLLRPRPEALAGTRDLDTSRLDVALAALPDHEVVFQHGIEHVRDRVASGEAQAGVLLRAVRVGQIVEIAHGGERMPPKTTFFHPKPRTGVVFHTLG